MSKRAAVTRVTAPAAVGDATVIATSAARRATVAA